MPINSTVLVTVVSDAGLGPELFLSPAPIESAAEQCEIAEAVREIAEAAKTFKLQRGRRLPIGQSTPCLVPEEQRDMDGQEDIDCSPSVVIKVTKTPE
jgi:hypothetical protein